MIEPFKAVFGGLRRFTGTKLLFTCTILVGRRGACRLINAYNDI